MAETPASAKVRAATDGDGPKTSHKMSVHCQEPTRADVILTTTLTALTSCIEYQCLHALAVKVLDKFRELVKASEHHFLPIPIRGLPSGKEVGRFINIDVGGTNLRVAFVELLGQHWSDEQAAINLDDESDGAFSKHFRTTHEKSWPIGEHLKMDKAEDLFSWIGACIAEVIRSGYEELIPAEKEELAMGITFSFPMMQTLLEEATLLPMGKGFAIASNLNLGKMLLTGYQRHRGPTETQGTKSEAKAEHQQVSTLPTLPELKPAAITNDAISTFLSVAYAVKARSRNRTVMGLIVGTGTNAAVPMKLRHFPASKIAHSKSRSIGDLSEADQVVTDTSWSVRPTGDPLSELGYPHQMGCSVK